MCVTVSVIFVWCFGNLSCLEAVETSQPLMSKELKKSPVKQ